MFSFSSPSLYALTLAALLAPALALGKEKTPSPPVDTAREKPDTGAFQAVVLSALEKAPKIQEAEAKLRAAQEKIPQSRAALLPNLSLNANATHRDLDWRGGRQKTDPEDAGLLLKQPLFNWQAVVALQQTDPLIRAAAADLVATRQEMLLSLTKSATELLQAMDVASLAQSNLALTKRHLESTEARFKVGELTRTDVSQAQARFASAEAEKIRADNDGVVSRVRFQELAGAPPPKGLVLPVAGVTELEQMKAADIMASRPELNAARLRLEVAQKDVEREKAAHLPTVNLTSSATRYTDQEVGRKDPVDENLVKVEVSMPLFSGGETFSKTREAHAAMEQQRAVLERLQLQATRELEQAQFELKSAQASERAFAEAVKANEAALAGVNEEFKVGTRTALDLLDAQHETFTAQTDLAKSRYRALLARYQLLYAGGHLEPAALWPGLSGSSGDGK